MRKSIIHHINKGRAVFCLLLLIASTGEIQAQLNPLGGIYFSNEYIGNPAMAGMNEGLNLNLGYRKPWSSMPGAPKTQNFTADYGTGKKAGLGLNVNNDEAGLIKRTRVMGTYSYALPFNSGNDKLRFGISFGFLDERVMSENINGDQNDVTVGKFNQRETYLDGDFGAAYTGDKLTLQVAIPNLKGILKKDDLNESADRSTFFSAVSYKLNFPNTLDGFGIEPKIAYRGIHGFDNILDAGANFSLANNAASVMAMYHSSKSATIGLGVNIASFGAINANYTTATQVFSDYAGGNFEINLKLNLLNPKKSSPAKL